MARHGSTRPEEAAEAVMYSEHTMVGAGGRVTLSQKNKR